MWLHTTRDKSSELGSLIKIGVVLNKYKYAVRHFTLQVGTNRIWIDALPLFHSMICIIPWVGVYQNMYYEKVLLGSLSCLFAFTLFSSYLYIVNSRKHFGSYVTLYRVMKPIQGTVNGLNCRQ